MDWLDRMNRALDYIESHLDAQIDARLAAQHACCSVFHFQRTFPYLTGVTLSEYIRRRRLTMAAFDLQHGGCKVIDVALKYGYESPEAFARAFKGLHGVMPTAARGKGTALKAFPRITFVLSVKGETEMNYRIEQKGAFSVFGVSADIRTADGRAFVEVPEFWDRCQTDGTTARIKELSGNRANACVNGALYNPRDDGFSYLICDFAPDGPTPEEFVRLDVDAATWAIFPAREEDGHVGDQVQTIWKRVFTEWFPASGYDHAEGPEFEVYFDRGNGIYGAEVWIPVRRNTA